MGKLTRATTPYVTHRDVELSVYLERTLSPLGFGASGDGVTDDTISMQEMMSEATDGTIIDLCGRTYVGELIVTRNNVRVTNGKIIASDSATKGCVVFLGVSRPKVDNVETFIDRDNLNRYSAINLSGIHFENCTRVFVEDCYGSGSKNNDYSATTSWGCVIHAFQCTGVTILNSYAEKSHTEGIMTRFSNDVWIRGCEAYDAGYSCIGTSSGDNAHIIDCRAARSGATVITMNSRNNYVTGCYVDAGGLFNGIGIGHQHEEASFAIDSFANDNLVRNCTGSGISISQGTNISISNNIIDNVTDDGIHVHSMTGNVLNIMSVVIDGNTVSKAGRSGIWCYEGIAANSTNYNIYGNNLGACTLYGIRMTANGSMNISGNTLNAITDIAIFIRNADNTTTQRIRSLSINGNKVLGCTLSAITTAPARYLDITDNTLSDFNSAAGAFSTAIAIVATVGASTFTLPDVLNINGNIIDGTVGASTAVINIGSDGLATSDRVASLSDNTVLRNGTRPFVTYPTSRYASLSGSGNTIERESKLLTVSVPASGTLTVSNKNILPFSMPNVTPRSAAGGNVIVTSLTEGSLVLQNLASSAAASVTIQL